MRRRQVIGGFMETEPVRLLAPERLDNEDAAEHHQADDVDCFFQGGSLAGAARPDQSFKPAAAAGRFGA